MWRVGDGFHVCHLLWALMVNANIDHKSIEEGFCTVLFFLKPSPISYSTDHVSYSTKTNTEIVGRFLLGTETGF